MDLVHDGFTIVPQVLSAPQCEAMRHEVLAAFSNGDADAIQVQHGRLVGGRNLISLWSGWRQLVRHPDVARTIHRQVGPRAGLVRILYFDKPPGQGWSLSLHRDKTIAVAQHHVPADPFSKPTVKADVPHVEATEQLLRKMLTLRIHLDPMCDANGPLVVVPGSHQDLSKTCDQASIPIYCGAGDLFVMRPLLLHGSRAASPETKLHRRVVHLEVAESETLPIPYRWNKFVSVNSLPIDQVD
jgi:hypothetical protein